MSVRETGLLCECFDSGRRRASEPESLLPTPWGTLSLSLIYINTYAHTYTHSAVKLDVSVACGERMSLRHLWLSQ